MKYKFLLVSMLLALFYSCGNSSQSNKIKLEFIEENPYVLKIDSFEWHKINDKEIVGDFMTLDKEIFDLFQKKVGICEIYIEHNPDFNKSNDKYDYLGFFNLKQHKKFTSWQQFHEFGGMKKLIEMRMQTIIPQLADSAKMADSTKMIDSAKMTIIDTSRKVTTMTDTTIKDTTKKM